MIEKAYGKINLSIDVIGERDDGYHLLDMIMLPIDVYDDVEVEVADKMSYSCNIDLPFTEKNIIYKTIEKLRKKYGFKENFNIKLTKRIPMEAGLAGGSTDAAAVIRMVNELLGLGMDLEEMKQFGATVGADVPYCVVSKPARVSGIGEVVREIDVQKSYQLLLVKPASGVSTKLAFDMLNYDSCCHPDMDKLEKAFVSGGKMTDYLGNSLEESAFRLNEDIETIIKEMKSFGLEDCLMSGSGSTCFSIVDDGYDLQEAVNYFQNKYPFVMVSKAGKK